MTDYTCVDYSVLIERLRECTPLMRTAADAIETLAKPVRSKWVRHIDDSDPEFRRAYFRCELCKAPTLFTTPFCGFCGSRMEPEIEEASND